MRFVSKAITSFIIVVMLLVVGVSVNAENATKDPRQGVTLEDAAMLRTAMEDLLQRGEYEAAIPFALEILAIMEKVQGPDHADTARALSDLGLVYMVAHQPELARSAYERALGIFDAVLGPDHEDTIFCREGLLALYDSDIYMSEEALAVAEPLYEAYKSALGVTDPKTVEMGLKIASKKIDIDEWETGLQMLQEIMSGMDAALGPDHQDTIKCRETILADLENRDGDGWKQDILEVAGQLYATYARTLGATDPRTVEMGLKVASNRLDAEDWETGLAIFHELESNMDEVFGPDHPDTIKCREAILNSLEIWYKCKDVNKRLNERLKVAKHLHEAYVKTLGKTDPATILMSKKIARIYIESDANDLALQLYLDSVSDLEADLGPTHERTIEALYFLADQYERMGDESLCIDTLVRIIQGLRQAYGADYYKVPEIMVRLGGKYSGMGEYEKALSMYEQALAIWENSSISYDVEILDLLFPLHEAYKALNDPRAQEVLERIKQMRGY